MKYRTVVRLTSLMLLLAVAGESSLHFLFHSLSREISVFSVPSSGDSFSEGSSCNDSHSSGIIESGCPCCAVLISSLLPESFELHLPQADAEPGMPRDLAQHAPAFPGLMPARAPPFLS